MVFLIRGPCPVGVMCAEVLSPHDMQAWHQTWLLTTFVEVIDGDALKTVLEYRTECLEDSAESGRGSGVFDSVGGRVGVSASEIVFRN